MRHFLVAQELSAQLQSTLCIFGIDFPQSHEVAPHHTHAISSPDLCSFCLYQSPAKSLHHQQLIILVHSFARTTLKLTVQLVKVCSNVLIDLYVTGDVVVVVTY